MPLLTPGFPSSSKRRRIECPIWFRELTTSGSRCGFTGFSKGGIQIRPGKGLD